MAKVIFFDTESQTGQKIDTPEFQSMGILIHFKKQEAQRATYRAPEYNVPPF